MSVEFLTFVIYVDSIRTYNIPPQLILNADQMPTSYISVGESTMAKCGEISVSDKGLSDKCSITL